MLVIERVKIAGPSPESQQRMEEKRLAARRRHGKDFAADSGSKFEVEHVAFLTRHWERERGRKS